MYQMFRLKKQLHVNGVSDDVCRRHIVLLLIYFAAHTFDTNELSLALIEEHSARLRPVELYPKWGSLEIWVAPGDSELDVAYSKPEIVFVQMFRDVENTDKVRNAEIGFAGELYENDEDVGFRTTRTDDGKARREIKSSVGQRQPSDKEMDDLMEILNSQVAADGVDQ